MITKRKLRNMKMYKYFNPYCRFRSSTVNSASNTSTNDKDNYCTIIDINSNGTNNKMTLKSVCILTVIASAFIIGIIVGFLMPVKFLSANGNNEHDDPQQEQQIRTIFFTNSYDGNDFIGNTSVINRGINESHTINRINNIFNNSADTRSDRNGTSNKIVDITSEGNDISFNKYNVSTNDSISNFSSVSFIEKVVFNNIYVRDDIYWSEIVEDSLKSINLLLSDKKDYWNNYIKSAVAIKLEPGCGRMQNRLVTFQDGQKGCVRYRQNTDQIQGELFSYYLARVLKLPNLAPSAVEIVDLDTPLWQNLRNEIASAQWNSNRPVVLTKFITNLNSANIPRVFKLPERHLNKFDVGSAENIIDNQSIIELAQWSDLIVFDYLTANLDRIVNNLYNYQWNANIMDAPAHNLAKRADTGLLVFLDNESGLLHGYRLLKKYETYHATLLENLCLFRRSTADIIKRLKLKGDVGKILRRMFEAQNSDKVRDILPTLPEKSIKILNDRIDKVYNQIIKCESIFRS